MRGGLKPDINIVSSDMRGKLCDSSNGILGVTSDHLGLLEAAGDEPEVPADGPLTGPEELDADDDGLLLDYSGDPTLEPFLEELLEDEAAELNSEAFATEQGESDEDSSW